MKIITRKIGVILMLLTSISTANELTGSIVPPFPEGWDDQGGSCVSTNLSIDRVCDYSIGILKKNNQRILYLGKAVPSVDPQKPRWLIKDQMPYPKTPDNYQVVYASCEKDGKSDSMIIAIVKITDTEWYTTVQSAYKANLNTEQFEKISVKGIRCINEGWGL